MFRQVEYKTIISKTKQSPYWFNYSYGANFYRGCNFNCIYCDSRSKCYHNDNFDEIAVKKDALKILEVELRTKKIIGTIGTGAMSDPYNVAEKTEKITRGFIQLAHIYQKDIHILTKSDLVLRDIDLLVKLNQTCKVSVFMTITTADDDLCRKIERNAPVTSTRFEVLRQLNEHGITTGVVVMPILPFINDSEENIREIVKKTAIVGTKYIYAYFGVTLRDTQRDYFFKYLKRDFSEHYDKYQRYFSSKYNCHSYNKNLYKIFDEECYNNKLINSLPKINKIFSTLDENQLQFDF